ncbi:unnamed protein product [Closterium sp. Yama58-4]|nr:unnamed protein product [Closterium sp. Yama58-4]
MVASEAAQRAAARSPSGAAMLAASNAGVGSAASSASGGGLTAEEDVTVLEFSVRTERSTVRLSHVLPAHSPSLATRPTPLLARCSSFRRIKPVLRSPPLLPFPHHLPRFFPFPAFPLSLPPALSAPSRTPSVEVGRAAQRAARGWLVMGKAGGGGEGGSALGGKGAGSFARWGGGKSGSGAGLKEGEDWEGAEEGEGEAEQGEGEAASAEVGRNMAFWRACVKVEMFLKICRSIGLYDVNVFTPPDNHPTPSPPPPSPSPPFSLRAMQICRSIGLYDVNVFTPPDLVERRDLRRVYLSHAAAFPINPILPRFSHPPSPNSPFSPPCPPLSTPPFPLPLPPFPPPLHLPCHADLSQHRADFEGSMVTATSATRHRLMSSVRSDYLPNLPTWLGPEQQAVVRSRSPARVPPWVVREGGGPAEAVRGRRRSASVTAVQRAPPATVTPRQPRPPRTHTSPLRSISPTSTVFHPSEPESLPDTSTMGRGGRGRMGQQEELVLLDQQQEEQQGRGLGARKWQLLAAAGAAVLVGGAVVMAAQRHQRLRSAGASSDWEIENLRRKGRRASGGGVGEVGGVGKVGVGGLGGSAGKVAEGKDSVEAGSKSAEGEVVTEGGFSHWLTSLPTGTKLTEKEFDER